LTLVNLVKQCGCLLTHICLAARQQ